MQEYKETYEKWRKMFLNTNLYFILFVFSVEVTMSLVLKKLNLIFQPIAIYLLFFLVLPTLLNFSNYIIVRIILKKIKQDNKYINYIPIIQMALIGLVVAGTHFAFPVTLPILCLPVFATVLFSDEKMTRNIGAICGIFLVIALLLRKYSIFRLSNDRYFLVETVIAIVMMIATQVICEIITKFQKEKNVIIYQSYLRQLELQEQLSKDQKTGLYGHTIFMNTLDTIVNLPDNEKEEIALAIIDIDDFKRINDTYGHLKGDQVIFRIAEIMKKSSSNRQLVARFGGEEFAVLFKGSGAKEAFSHLESIRKEFEKQKYGFADIVVTISIGIANWKPGWTSEQLFDYADTAMYLAKTSGKNRIEIYE